MAVFGWCLAGQHSQCKREFQEWHMAPNKKRGEPPFKIVLGDEFVRCECLTRSCACYVKPADRTKVSRRRRKS